MPISLQPSRFWVQVLSGVGLVVLLVVIFWYPGLPGGSPAVPPDAQASPFATALTGSGRGRTSATVPPVVVVQPTAIPTPATPTGPVATATASPGPGTGTGTGTGTGPGTGVGALPPRQATDDRFIFVVLDSDTRKPIKGVCVTYGNQCVPGERETNADGIFYVDFPRGVARIWLFEFWMPGYEPQGRQVPYTPGEQTEPIEIWLRRIR